ncbi:redoxin family protein [Anaplasma capra]|uniref:redoxin family protein n=1 Tax=Anaplasma capra TaxID=1562740 RepID=UPI0021D57B03|nr:redoxin family protein [Anaplasma capra]MCU7611723.1 DsbE family thiol:disulfide interchange protein [Anaplasma capra]MCU7612526.1 DsbE family thiol:disulfide interchange protein [Anaplasma capra]
MRVIAATVLAMFCLLSLVSFWAYYNRIPKEPYGIVLPTLVGADEEFRTDDIRGAYVMHVFASWCTTCLEEHKVWMEITEGATMRVYGIAYLDIKQKTLEWLENHGNPYTMVAVDYSGRSMKKLGVTGVPETLVFDQTGRMVAHITGSMTRDLWRRISTLVD